MSIVNLSSEFFVDPDTGKPLANGYVYVGEPDLDPQITGNRKAVTFRLEDGSEVSAPQPLRIGLGGHITYNGSTPVVLVDPDYSVKVLDSGKKQKWYVPSADDGDTTPVVNASSGISRWSTQNIAYIAERGLSSAAPENTTPALRLAGDSGLWGSKFSVRLTSDEAWILMHDDTVDRTTNGTGLVASLTLASIQALDAGTWFNSYYAGAIVPSLQEALNVCRGSNQKPVIDIRGAGYSDAQIQSLIDSVKSIFPNDGYLIASETLTNLQQVRSLDTDSGLLYEVPTFTTLSVDECVTLGNCDLSVFYGNISDISYAHTNDIAVIAWVVSSQNDINDVAASGVSAVTTTEFRQNETPRDQFSIDLSGLDWTTIVPETASDSANFTIEESLGEFEINSITNLGAIVASCIPNEVAIGARVEVSAEVRSVTGSQAQLYIDSFTDSAYGGLNGAGGTSEAVTDADASTEYRTVTANFHVKPDNQFIRVGIGFKAPLIGNAYFRNLKITIDGADALVNNPSSLTRDRTQAYDFYRLNQQLPKVVVAPATVVDSFGNIVFTASTTASSGEIVFGGQMTDSNYQSAFKFLDSAAGVEVIIKGRTTGASIGMIAMDYYLDDDGALVDTVKCYFVMTDDTQRFWFPSIPDTNNGRLRIGMDDTGTIESDFSLRFVKMSLLDAQDSSPNTGLQPVSISIRNDGVGVWTQEDVFSSEIYPTANITSFNVDGINDVLTINFDRHVINLPYLHVQWVRPTNPLPASEIAYTAELSSLSYMNGSTSANITIFDKSTGLKVDPEAINADASLSIFGFFVS
jgi:glycerophosphoryl diester phosphodiesterase